MQFKYLPLLIFISISTQLINADSFPADEWEVISPSDVGVNNFICRIINFNSF